MVMKNRRLPFVWARRRVIKAWAVSKQRFAGSRAVSEQRFAGSRAVSKQRFAGSRAVSEQRFADIIQRFAANTVDFILQNTAIR